ncbi:hypothetical protein Nocox_00685 [Nonomuraea coxensis DSM 45129]|uniref:Uncharacterized protein n=1 Tax=Nonomuraea coxensis DSM 45129 TaxID=1122611 RepID=A0ABX8TR84_9ACTN|nr:hypothetical protein [Nonomuraea coxensis]QYC37774.1 hypothetical protein Nocox_00685 [Nonomuraea coxensis DSM 45129]
MAYASASGLPGGRPGSRPRLPYGVAVVLLTALLALLTLAPATSASASSGTAAQPQRTAPEGRVALVGVPGLQWSDLDPARTPALWKLVAQGSSASLSTRAVPPPDRGITCPVAGWLTVSAGRRAGVEGKGCPAPAAPRPSGQGDGAAAVPGWQAMAAHQSDTGYDARLGTLGQLVADAGGKVAAIGPGAAIAGADKSGNIAKYAPTPDALGDLSPYSLVVLDAAALADAWSRRPLDEYGVPTAMPTATRQAAATEADRQVAALLDRLPPGTTILVAGLSDVTPNAHLHVALAAGPSPTGEPYPRGHLTAASTRQDALVTITDLTATAIELLGLPQPREVVGRPWQAGAPASGSAADTVSGLADADLASQVLRDVRGPFFTVLVTLQLLFYAWAALALRRRSTTPPEGEPAPSPEGGPAALPEGGTAGPAEGGPAAPADGGTAPPAGGDTTTPPGNGTAALRGGDSAPSSGADAAVAPAGGEPGDASASKLLRAVQIVAVLSGAIAVSTFLAQLVPWWTLPVPMVSVIVTILGIAALLTAAAFAGPWRAHVLGPLTVVAALTSLALLVDVMTGSRLQVNAVTGYEPVTGGRFYGFSNIAFAVYSTGTILGLAGVAQWLLGRGVSRLLVVGACAVSGMFAVFADGWPSWGADFGGVPAFVVGLAVFLILLSGRRVSVLRLLLVGVAGVAIVGVLSVVDWLRPEAQRTHLGTFVQQVIDGQAWTVVGRKFSAMIGVTVGNWSLTLLTLVALAFLFLVLARPSRYGAAALGQVYALAPTLRAGLFGALTCAFVGFLMNDSGIAIPAMALTVAVPLTLAACVRALQLSRPTPPGRSSGRAAPTPSEAGPRR